MNYLNIYRLSFLRKIVSKSVILYKIWFYLIRRNKGDYVRLPKSSDNLYFDGYPRSGNTYFSGLIKTVFPHFKFTSHLHSISGIKIAKQKNLKIFIIIRHPKDVIASNMFRLVNDKNYPPDQDLADSLLKSYVKYYKLCLLNIKHIKIIDFEKSIKNKNYFIETIIDGLGGIENKIDDVDELILKNDDKLKNKENIKRKETSALPDDKREKFKNKKYKLIESSHYYDDAITIYKKLITNG